jgi:hypothetical protein
MTVGGARAMSPAELERVPSSTSLAYEPVERLASPTPSGVRSSRASARSAHSIHAMEKEKDVEHAEHAEHTPLPLLPPEIGPAPEGGLRAWLTVTGSVLATFATFGITNAFGVFQAYYQTNQLRDHNSSTISWIGAVQQFLLFFNVSAKLVWSR